MLHENMSLIGKMSISVHVKSNRGGGLYLTKMSFNIDIVLFNKIPVSTIELPEYDFKRSRIYPYLGVRIMRLQIVNRRFDRYQVIPTVPRGCMGLHAAIFRESHNKCMMLTKNW